MHCAVERMAADPSAPVVFSGKDDLTGLLSSKDYQKVKFIITQIRAIWNKFTIFDSSHLPKEFLLRLIMGLVSPFEFIPIHFHTKGRDSIFYARDCGGAIEMLLRFNLKIPLLGASTLSTLNKKAQPNKKKTTAIQEKYTSTVSADYGSYLLSKDSVDLSNIGGSENDKIKAMMTQSTIDYDPSNYKKHLQEGDDVPASYKCHKCHMRGHFIKDCPILQRGMLGLHGRPAPTGIPLSFLEKVTDYSLPGAMFSPATGDCYVRTTDLKEQEKNQTQDNSGNNPVAPKRSIENVVIESEQEKLDKRISEMLTGNQVCSTQLIMQIEIDTKDHVKLQPCLSKILQNVVSRRYSASRNNLDLSSFHSDSGLEKEVFFPISINKNMGDVVNIVCTNIAHLCSINLAGNCLYDIEATKSFVHALPQLRTLDLRNNSLELSALDPLNGLRIKDLFLDGNPLCDDFDSENQYAEVVRKFFPELQCLDGVRLCVVGPPKLQLFYLCNPEGKQLVEQFIEHYFSMYDSPYRNLLLGVYHEEAKLSITCSYLTSQTTSANARLSEYIKYNRNLLRLSDCSKIDKLMLKTNTDIISVISKFPRSEHDPTSFTVELHMYKPTIAVVSITGIFKEPSNPNVSPRYFKRHFTLLPTENNTFVIVNELFYVTNCTTHQADMAFKFLPIISASPLNTYLTTRKSPKLRKEEKKDMIDTIADLTEMNKKWSKKCLVDVMWDIRAALILFNNNYKAGNIPFDAFIK